MKRVTKRLLILITVVVVIAVSWFIYSFNNAYQWIMLEGNIAHGTFSIVDAVDNYIETHGSPPSDLGQLAPNYLDQLPSIEGVQKIEYAGDPETGHWSLTLHSRARGQLR